MLRFTKLWALCLGSVALLPAQTPATTINPTVKRIVDEISQERIAANLKKFEGFGTRYILSSDDDPVHGIGAAKRWIYGEFKGYSPKLEVSYQTFRVRKGARRGQVLHEVELANVVAILPGTVDRDRYVLVTAHYDTVNLHRKPQFTDAERVADLVKRGMEEAEAQRVIQLFPHRRHDWRRRQRSHRCGNRFARRNR